MKYYILTVALLIAAACNKDNNPQPAGSDIVLTPGTWTETDTSVQIGSGATNYVTYNVTLTNTADSAILSGVFSPGSRLALARAAKTETILSYDLHTPGPLHIIQNATITRTAAGSFSYQFTENWNMIYTYQHRGNCVKN